MAPTKPTKPARAGQPTWAFDTGAPPRRRRSPRSRHPLAPRWPTLRRWRPPRPSMATRAHARAQDEKRPPRGRGAEKRYRSGGERRDRAHPMPPMRRLAGAGVVVVGAGEMEPAHDGYIPGEVRECLTWVARCKRWARRLEPERLPDLYRHGLLRVGDRWIPREDILDLARAKHLPNPNRLDPRAAGACNSARMLRRRR